MLKKIEINFSINNSPYLYTKNSYMKQIIAVFFLTACWHSAWAQLQIRASNGHIKITDFNAINSLIYPNGLKHSFYSGADFAITRTSDNGEQPAKEKNYIPYDQPEAKDDIVYKQEDRIPIIASQYMFYLYYTDINNDITRYPQSR